MKKVLLSCLMLLAFGSESEARVFNINKETFAAYFSVGGGSSLLGATPFDNESGSGVTFDKKVQYNYQGEFGFLYSRPRASLRFGIEFLKPQSVETTANDGTDDLYTNTVDILGFVPKLTLELNLHRGQTYRSFFSAGVGLADITMKNSYEMTTAGQTAYPGIYSHSIEAKGSATTLTAALGYEGLLSDTTTILFETGYRQLKVDNLKYSKAADTFTGSKTAGDPVVDSSGDRRNLDLGGFFVNIGFRFFL